MLRGALSPFIGALMSVMTWLAAACALGLGLYLLFALLAPERFS